MTVHTLKVVLGFRFSMFAVIKLFLKYDPDGEVVEEILACLNRGNPSEETGSYTRDGKTFPRPRTTQERTCLLLT